MVMAKIHPEFCKVCPPLSDGERDLLEKDILANGCRDPLCIWEGYIVDGHNRYEICTKHGIEFTTVELQLKDEEDAKRWIITNQLSRRNLGFIQAAYLRGCHYRTVRAVNEINGGNTQKQVAELFNVSVATIRSDGELADAIDRLCDEGRLYVLRHSTIATRQQIGDFSRLSHTSQRLIIEKMLRNELKGLRDAVLRLRPSSKHGLVDGQRKRWRCPSCGARMAEGVFTCLKCDLDDGEVKQRLESPRGLGEDDKEEIEQRIAMAREFKQHGDDIGYAATVIIEWLAENEVERNSDCRQVLCRLSNSLLEKVGTRRENDKVLRVLIDADGEDQPRRAALTKRERELFDFIRSFSIANGRPPKLVEMCDAVGFTNRGHANGYVTRLRDKGIVVRD